ncbi:MAG: YceI family protein [Nibricoccus sp.]
MKSPLILAALLLAPFASPLSAVETPLVVDKQQSHIEYNVTATMDSFSGRLSAYDLELADDPAVTGKISRAELRFRFADLRSNNAKRDQQMRDWQNTEQFPECIFTLTALEPAATAGHFTARGQFIFHGMTRDLVFPVSLSNSEDGLHVIDGEAKIDTRDFGLPIIRKFGLLKVDPVVVVKLHLQARPAAAK